MDFLCYLLDGKICDFKKSKKRNNNYIFEYQTENDDVHMQIKSFYPESAKNWWLWQILFFFTSLFGLLDWTPRKKWKVINYDATINLSADVSDVKILVHRNSKDKKAVKLITESAVTETENKLYIDKVAKKRMTFVIIFKIVFWIALIFGLVMIFMNI